MDELLRIHSLTVDLPTAAGWVRPVNEVTLRIAPGEVLGLVGESGSGKTMLSLALMGLLPPGARVSGEAFLKAAGAQQWNLTQLSAPEWREVRGREIAMIFQEPMTSLNLVLRIGAQIEEAIWAHEPGLAAQRYCSSGDGRSGASRRARTRFQSLLKSTDFCGPQ
ncbi:MAG: ATP-binding cassette domain-containing protein [Candidatus Acidiferrum sp.]